MPKMIVGGRQAKVGEGEWRVGVHLDLWEEVKNTLENISTPKKMIVDGAAVKVDEGTWRVDVFIDMFDQFTKRLENV